MRKMVNGIVTHPTYYDMQKCNLILCLLMLALAIVSLTCVILGAKHHMCTLVFSAIVFVALYFDRQYDQSVHETIKQFINNRNRKQNEKDNNRKH